MDKVAAYFYNKLFLLVFLSILLGTFIAIQFSLFEYFYNSQTIDLAIFIFFFILGFTLSKLFISIKPKAQLFSLMVFSIIVSITEPLLFQLYQTLDLISILTYTLVCIGAGLLSLLLRKQSNYDLLLSLSIICLSGSVQYSFPSAPILVGTTIILTVIYSLLFLYHKMYFLWSSMMLIIIGLSIFYNSSFASFTKYERQRKYYDKVIYSHETPFQHIDITEWRGNRWYYYNNINQFSTIDEWLYYEPLVHPILNIADDPKHILVIGGENGMAIKELAHYKNLQQIDHIVLDSALYNLAKTNELFKAVNNDILNRSYSNMIYDNVFKHLYDNEDNYDIIIVDVPDPVDIELNQYYTLEFYKLCGAALKEQGIMVTQAGSPYYATQAYYCISNTISSANMQVLELHNQVLTLGEWGWIIGAKNTTSDELKNSANALHFDHIETKWLNNEAMKMMMSFGKTHLPIDSIQINTLNNPVVHKLYTNGTYKF